MAVVFADGKEAVVFLSLFVLVTSSRKKKVGGASCKHLESTSAEVALWNLSSHPS